MDHSRASFSYAIMTGGGERGSRLWRRRHQVWPSSNRRALSRSRISKGTDVFMWRIGHSERELRGLNLAPLTMSLIRALLKLAWALSRQELRGDDRGRPTTSCKSRSAGWCVQAYPEHASEAPRRSTPKRESIACSGNRARENDQARVITYVQHPPFSILN